MYTRIGIKQFIKAIEKLPSDKPQNVPGKWYKTQKEHWLGWLREYKSPGRYWRKGGKHQDAEFAYNHIVEYRMLLWIIKAANVDQKLIRAAMSVANPEKTLQTNSAAIRNIVPWKIFAEKLWGSL